MPYKHVLTYNSVGKMHSVVIEMKSVQQYFLHYAGSICFSVCHKKKLKLQLYAEFCQCQSWYSFCITGKYFSSENNFFKVTRAFRTHLDPFTCVTLCNVQEILGDEVYSQTCTNGHLSNTVIFLVYSPYIHSCFNLSTMATFFCPQGGCCREVQLYTMLCSNPGAQLLLLGN